MKLSCGFGAGMGRNGRTCGAISAAIMVLGLEYGMTDSEEQERKVRTYEKVRELVGKFESRHGTIMCNDLLGCDISTEEGFTEAQEKNLTNTICLDIIDEVSCLLDEML
jgi:C_GCAxxG_C_C family probable redox protein